MTFLLQAYLYNIQHSWSIDHCLSHRADIWFCGSYKQLFDT